MRNTACVICGKELNSAFWDDTDDQAPPSGATVFISHGNYGSTVWDPMTPEYLQVTLCDKCLSQAAASGRVLHCEPQPVTTPVIYSTWTGPREEL